MMQPRSSPFDAAVQTEKRRRRPINTAGDTSKCIFQNRLGDRGLVAADGAIVCRMPA